MKYHFDPITKTTTWNEIDPWLTDELYLHLLIERKSNIRDICSVYYGKEVIII